MPGREDDYVEIQRNCAWLRQLEGTERSGQFYRISKGLTGQIRKRALDEKLAPEQYRVRLAEAGRFLDDLRLALYPYQGGDAETTQIWSHRSVERAAGVEKDPEESIDGRSLQMATAYYLARPWMQHNETDWILLDALMYGELIDCREYIYRGEAVGKINWAYVFAAGNPVKALWVRLLMYLGVWVARYILPAALITGLFLLGYQRAAIAAAGFYVLYLAARFVLWPHRYRRRKSLGRELKLWEDRWTKMLVAYALCEPPVISPAILREQISKPTEIGPLFSAAVFAVLDRIIGRDRDVFLPLESLAEVDDEGLDDEDLDNADSDEADGADERKQ